MSCQTRLLRIWARHYVNQVGTLGIRRPAPPDSLNHARSNARAGLAELYLVRGRTAPVYGDAQSDAFSATHAVTDANAPSSACGSLPPARAMSGRPPPLPPT